VRSRATGLYGETLHSGQVSDRASPATGDYVRSDVSEEPQQPHAHGRSTRAANKSASNGRSTNRTIVSDDEEDATSWDGGDEDEDEPEQMELDGDEDDQGDDSSEDGDEPQTLMVTLRYGKGSSGGPTTSSADTSSAIGANNHGVSASGLALADHGTPRQPEQQIPVPVEPALPPALQPHPVTTLSPTQPQPMDYAGNGVPAPVIPVVQHLQSVGNPAVLPKLEGMFAAPAQPYTVPADQPAQQQPFPPTLTSPTPASTWQ
jgi:hypothetical protein